MDDSCTCSRSAWKGYGGQADVTNLVRFNRYLLIAYMAGPVCGGIVGFTNNIVYGIFVDQQSVFCIVGALLGIVVGYLPKRRFLRVSSGQ